MDGNDVNGNDLAQLRELVEFLRANEIAEFDVERGDLKLRMKFAGAVPPAPAAMPPSPFDVAQWARSFATAPASQRVETIAASPVESAHAGTPGSGAPVPAVEAKLHTVKSPIVGTFYESPSPGSPAFVKPGDVVELGQVLCIVEAMKLMNEIESDAAGEIVSRVAVSGQPVEYGQPLFTIRAIE